MEVFTFWSRSFGLVWIKVLYRRLVPNGDKSSFLNHELHTLQSKVAMVCLNMQKISIGFRDYRRLKIRDL